MNLLAGYGSDDDDDDEIPCEVQQITTRPLNSEVNGKITQLSKADGVERKSAKPKRKLDIGYLPPEILAALARGDSAVDSDDDDFPVAANAPTSSKSNDSDFTSPLLSILPAPKQQNDKSAALPLYKGINCSKEPEGGTTAPKTKPTFNFSYVEQTAKSTDGDVGVDVHKVLASASTSSTIPFSRPTPLPSFTRAPVTAAPVVDSVEPLASYPLHPSSSSSISSRRFTDGTPNISSSNAYETREARYDDFSSSGGGPANAKKRQRELEHQLMNGDLSGIHNAKVSDVRVGGQWNSEKYNEQQQRELAIQQSFGKAAGSIAMPSKVQNRKHQLNSLALRAAETELAMLDAKGALMKSKRETQGKYGW